MKNCSWFLWNISNFYNNGNTTSKNLFQINIISSQWSLPLEHLWSEYTPLLKTCYREPLHKIYIPLMKGHFLLKDTSYWWTLPIDGHFLLMVTSYWRLLPIDGHFLLKDTSYWWTLPIEGHFLLMDTSYWWTLPIDGHFLLKDTSYWRTLHIEGHFILKDTSY